MFQTELWASQGGFSGKEHACQCRILGWIPAWGKSPGGGNGNPGGGNGILSWEIPWTEEPGRLQSTGSQRVGQDWSDLAHTQLLIEGALPFRSKGKYPHLPQNGKARQAHNWQKGLWRKMWASELRVPRTVPAEEGAGGWGVFKDACLVFREARAPPRDGRTQCSPAGASQRGVGGGFRKAENSFLKVTWGFLLKSKKSLCWARDRAS